MKILLVQPPLDPITSQLAKLGMAEPLGLEYIAGALPDHDVKILDARVDDSLVETLVRFTPDVVGVPALTASLSASLSLLAQVKAYNKEIFTVIGGPHLTLVPLDCQVDEVNAIVLGDGEFTFSALVRNFSSSRDFRDIPNLMYRDGTEWKQTQPCALPSLGGYAQPARHLTERYRKHYQRVGLGSIVSAVTSRGCSQRCSFCSVWRFHDGKYRTRTPDSIVKELESRTEMTIDFVDDDSFGSVKRMDVLAKLVSERLPGRRFRFFARTDTIVKHPDTFNRWSETGLVQLLLGIESFRDDDLRDMNKSASAAQNKRALQLCNDLGIKVAGYLLVRPDFDICDFDRLSETVEENQIALPAFSVMTPFPGTVFYEQVKDQLTTTNRDHFDGFHAVLPTKLPKPEFYHQVAQLYRKAYKKSSPSSSDETPWWESLASAVENLRV